MKKRLRTCSVLSLVLLSGCIHFSDVEVRSSDAGALVANTGAVEKEVDGVLAASNFAPVLDKRFEQKKHALPNFVAEWERLEDRGFWHGTEYLSVEMSARRDLIVLVISSGRGDRRDVVEAIRAVLENMIHDKLPDLKVHVTSYSYYPFWAP